VLGRAVNRGTTGSGSKDGAAAVVAELGRRGECGRCRRGRGRRTERVSALVGTHGSPALGLSATRHTRYLNVSGFRASLLTGLCQVCDSRRYRRIRSGERLEPGDRRAIGARHQVRVSSGDDQAAMA